MLSQNEYFFVLNHWINKYQDIADQKELALFKNHLDLNKNNCNTILQNSITQYTKERLRRQKDPETLEFLEAIQNLNFSLYLDPNESFSGYSNTHKGWVNLPCNLIT
jgi:hypothetical protein